MEIKLQPITNNITKYKRKIEYIVIHYTAASSSNSKASSIAKQFNNTSRKASADFVVDDQSIIQANGDPLNQYCWAVGDGKGKYGVTNKNSIHIEICSNLKKDTTLKMPNHTGWYFTEASLNNTRDLVIYLMKEYNIDIDHVIRHYDASKKACPGLIGWNKGNIYTTNGSRTNQKNNEDEWIKFKKSIQEAIEVIEVVEPTDLNDLNGDQKPLNPNISVEKSKLLMGKISMDDIKVAKITPSHQPVQKI